MVEVSWRGSRKVSGREENVKKKTNDVVLTYKHQVDVDDLRYNSGHKKIFTKNFNLFVIKFAIRIVERACDKRKNGSGLIHILKKMNHSKGRNLKSSKSMSEQRLTS